MQKINQNLGSIFKKNWFPIQKLKNCIISGKLEYHCQLTCFGRGQFYKNLNLGFKRAITLVDTILFNF